MKTVIQIELQPFEIPKFVYVVPKIGRRQDGIGQVQKFALHELSRETIEQLCDNFKEKVIEEYQKVHR